MTGDGVPASPAERSLARALFGLVCAVYLLTASGHLYLADAWASLRTAESIATRGALDIPFDSRMGGKHGKDGRFYAKYGPAIAVHMLVPAVAGRALESRFDDTPRRTVAMGLVASFVNVPFAALTVVLFFLAGTRMGFGARACLWASLAVAFCTMVWPYAKHDAAEPQLSLALFASFYLLLARGPAGALPAGLCLGWGLLVKPSGVVALPVLAAYLWCLPGGRCAAVIGRFLAGPALAGLATLGLGAIRFGDPFDTGYSAEVQGYSIPLPIGLYGLLLSPGKGLLVFSPILVAAGLFASRFARLRPAECAVAGAHLALSALFFGMWQNWDGDWAWGPRYLLPCVPFAMLPLLSAFDPRPSRPVVLLCVLLAVVSAGVQVLGTAVDHTQYARWISSEKRVFGDFLEQPDKVYIPFHPHHFNPDLSPIRGHFHLLRATVASALGRPLPPMVLYSSIEERSDSSGHHLERVVQLPVPGQRLGLDAWPLVVLALFSGSPAAILVVLVGLGALAILFVRSRRAIARALREPAATVPATPGR